MLKRQQPYLRYVLVAARLPDGEPGAQALRARGRNVSRRIDRRNRIVQGRMRPGPYSFTYQLQYVHGSKVLGATDWSPPTVFVIAPARRR